MENYIKVNIVPKGLRIKITPAIRSRTTTLLTRWEKELTDSSIRLMTILLEEEKVTLEESSKKLKDTIDQALKHKNDPEFVRRELLLQNNIEKYQSSIKERKHKQYKRDLAEFKDKCAYQYLWTKETDVSSTDIESSDTEGNNYTYPRGSYQRGGRNRKRGGGRNRNRGAARWHSPNRQDMGERDNRGLAPYPPQTHTTSGTGPSTSSSPPPFLESNGGAPYGLRDRRRPR